MNPLSLQDVVIVSFESRMADETRRLIENYGGRAVSAPSMQEVPLERHHDVFAFGERLMAGSIDVLILLTGVGTRMLVDTLHTRYDEKEIISRLADLVIVARGPKPVRALKAYGLSADLKVPEPNTWREVIETIDESLETTPLAGKHFAVQEYGVPNNELIDALRERGANVEPVSIYRWELPDDLEPLKTGIRSLIDGRAKVAMFTSRTQADHMMQVAEREGWAEELKRSLEHVLVASIGPVCTAGLRTHGIEPDLEPEHPKLGVLLRDLARHYG